MIHIQWKEGDNFQQKECNNLAKEVYTGQAKENDGNEWEMDMTICLLFFLNKDHMSYFKL